jgi:hypothetical protein
MGTALQTAKVTTQFGLTVFALAVTLLPSLVDAAWYDTNWPYRKQVTIDFNQVNGNLTNFPVLINLSTDAALSANAQADGTTRSCQAFAWL